MSIAKLVVTSKYLAKLLSGKLYFSLETIKLITSAFSRDLVKAGKAEYFKRYCNWRNFI